jgi:hypothetical protein
MPALFTKYVHPTEAIHDATHHALHRRLVGDVAGNRQRLRADLSELARRLIGRMEVVNGYRIPALGELEGNLTPDAASRARHYGDP